MNRGDGMGYRIDYTAEKKCDSGKNRAAVRMQVMIAVGLLAFSLLVKCFWPDGTAVIKKLVTAAGISDTQVAAESLVEDLKSGIPIPDALTEFCIAVIENERNH